MNSRPGWASSTRRKRGKLNPASSEVLGQTIKRQIVQRTSGRIQMLEVEVTDTTVVIHGSVPSYYVKQLTLRGVLDVIGSTPGTRVELDVHVVERDQRAF